MRRGRKAVGLRKKTARLPKGMRDANSFGYRGIGAFIFEELGGCRTDERYCPISVSIRDTDGQPDLEWVWWRYQGIRDGYAATSPEISGG